MRHLITALRGMRRNPILNAVSIGTAVLALLIWLGFVVIHRNLTQIVEKAASGMRVYAYLVDDLTDEKALALAEQAKTYPGVADVRYVSRDAAMEDLKHRLGQRGGILEGLGGNPLPASLELDLAPGTDTESTLEAVTERLRGLEGVEEVEYSAEWLDKVRGLMGFLHSFGLILGGLLGLAVMLIVGGAIRMTVMARKNEVEILRLIGATESFVRTPFLIAGAVHGAVGAALAVAVGWVLFRLLTANLDLPFGLTPERFVYIPPSLALGVIVGAGILGVVGAYMSMRWSEA